MSQKFFTVLCEVEVVVTTEYIVAADSAEVAACLAEMGAGSDDSTTISGSPIAKIIEYSNTERHVRAFVVGRSNAANYRRAIEKSPAAAACSQH